MKKGASVIFTTYNQVDWLEKVLWGFEYQIDKNFEIIIADDGSSEETSELISSYSKDSSLSIKHIWHKDDGFRKTEILNKAIKQTTSDYLIFTDGDCIPRNDFVKVHLEKKVEKFFLSGGYFKLPLFTSKLISHENISTQQCFEHSWLRENKLPFSLRNIKLQKNTVVEKVLNLTTTTKPSWNGHNASTWKKDILKVNGFDERMRYGGEDREFGERLVNLGLKPIQIRYSAICLHLDHPRSYIKKEDLKKNAEIREQTKVKKSHYTPFGITPSDT